MYQNSTFLIHEICHIVLACGLFFSLYNSDYIIPFGYYNSEEDKTITSFVA